MEEPQKTSEELMSPSPFTLETIDTKRSWAFRRQVLFFGALSVGAIALLLGVYVLFIHKAPTCNDGVQNGVETGVDCGGSCSRICVAEITLPQVNWVRVFKITDTIYHVVAYIDNKNTSIGTEALPYTVTLYAGDTELETREGDLFIPPDKTQPLFEGRFIVEEGVMPTRATVTLHPYNTDWYTGTNAEEKPFIITNRQFENTDTFARLTATIKNTAYTDVHNVEVIAVVFDNARVPLAASATMIPTMTARDESDMIFSWPTTIAELRSCIEKDAMRSVSSTTSTENTIPTPATTTVTDASEKKCSDIPSIIDIIPVYTQTNFIE